MKRARLWILVFLVLIAAVLLVYFHSRASATQLQERNPTENSTQIADSLEETSDSEDSEGETEIVEDYVVDLQEGEVIEIG